ncbi:hypothetical protein Poly21_08570 [Allorhodopirellula heiligendammensis]|uniref:Uncharacterized protein n=1 Tax=Allorhodopirellula heiligendammensis TaxID=2714739 RepID=A0A5C6C3M9_9BACT|nr:hypothetical protein Poly21_08570 [Allorhodopirellula heiligendammensis]
MTTQILTDRPRRLPGGNHFHLPNSSGRCLTHLKVSAGSGLRSLAKSHCDRQLHGGNHIFLTIKLPH